MMAARFLALRTDQADLRAGVAARLAQMSLCKVFEAESVTVFANGPCRPGTIGQGRGVLLGKLFSKRDFLPVVDEAWRAPDPSTGDGIAGLIEHCWGQYVAIVQSDPTTTTLFRDPSGGLPCYHVSDAGFIAAASDVPLLLAAGLLHPQIDWDYIAFQLRFPNRRCSATALRGIAELLPGSSLTWRPEAQSTAPRWLPWRTDMNAEPMTMEKAAQALRSVVDGCVRAYAESRHDPVLVGVSGGLDSSIIASALSNSEVAPEFVTVATKHPSGDERSHARVLCASLGRPLHEAFLSCDHVDLARPSAAHLPRPVGEPFLQSHDHIVRATAKRVGARTLFRGNGGDAVFCSMQNVMPILDHLSAIGLRLRLTRTVRDVCRITDSGLAAVGKAVLKRRHTRGPSSVDRLDESFLTSRGLEMPSYPGHPWLAPEPGVPLGRATHLQWIIRVQRFAEGYARDDDLELVCPLLAQPIVETCLAIPSWLWVSGGMNRAVARHAYRDALPVDILKRTVKGGPDPFCIELLEENRNFVRERLLDGLLAGNGVIDRGAVESYLAHAGPPRDDNYLRILALVDAEAWVRHWSDAASSRVSARDAAGPSWASPSHMSTKGLARPG